MTTERNPHRHDRIMDAAEDLTTIWRSLGPGERRMVNENVGRDLYRALHALAIEVEGRVPLPSDGVGWTKVNLINGPDTEDGPDEDDGTVNGAPGVTGFAPPVDDVPELQARIQAIDARMARKEALKQARKAWPMIREDAAHQAAEIITIAQAFEKYLTDGAATSVSNGRRSLDELADDLEDLLGPHSKLKLQQVIMAAVEWVDTAHLTSRSGLENWRNWADDHDVHLINAVLRYRGMPPLESEKP